MTTPSDSFSDFEIFPNYYNGFTFTWAVGPGYIADRPWTFIVYESHDEGQTWHKISPPLVDKYVYQEECPRRYDKDNRLIYKVVLTPEHGKTIESFTLAPYATLDLYTKNPKRELLLVKEIMRKEMLMLRSMSGVPIIIWRKDPFKRIRSDNVDPILGTVIDPESEPEDLYFGPYSTYGAFTPARRDKEQSPNGLGVVQNYVYNVRLLGFPYINDMDILIDVIQDRRYYVDAIVNVAELRRFPIVQQVLAKEIPKDDPAYKL